MSGGSWDYVYLKVEDAADKLCRQDCALRRALGEHLKLVAGALHDIEWVDSSDYGHGDEIKAIKAVFGDSAEERQLTILFNDARQIIEKLKELGA